MQLTIKNVQEEIFREFKAESVRNKLNLGQALTLAMKIWMEDKQKKSRLNLLDLKPKAWGKGTEKTSEEVDSLMYES